MIEDCGSINFQGTIAYAEEERQQKQKQNQTTRYFLFVFDRRDNTPKKGNPALTVNPAFFMCAQCELPNPKIHCPLT